MKLVQVFEGESELADFVAYVLKKNGINAEVHHLVHSSKDELSNILGKEFAPGWNPNRVVMVPQNQKGFAEQMIHTLAELNWYEKKPKSYDITKDIWPQKYGYKPWPKKKKGGKKK